MSERDNPCPVHCGYYDHGQSLIDHMRHEHRPCPECGAGKDDGQDEEYLRTYSLAHRRGCPRLQPGYVYPEHRVQTASRDERHLHAVRDMAAKHGEEGSGDE